MSSVCLQDLKAKWQCVLCQKRREYACATGKWFHGRESKPALNEVVFQRKVTDIWSGTESDWVSCFFFLNGTSEYKFAILLYILCLIKNHRKCASDWSKKVNSRIINYNNDNKEKALR